MTIDFGDKIKMKGKKKMKSKKIIALLIATIMLVVAFAGCQSSPAEEKPASQTKETNKNPEADQKKVYKIGLSLPSYEFTLFSAMAELFESECKKNGVEGQVFNAESNQEKQNGDIEDMITMGFDAVIVCPITVEGAAPAMKYLNENNIPLFTVDRQVTKELGVEVVSHISVDQVEIGRMAGRAFLQGLEEKFPDAEEWIVLELEGTAGASSAIDRSNGINEILSTEPRVKKLQNLNANYDTNTAVSVTEDVLTAHPELMGIVAANDMMIEGSLQALKNFNKVGDVLLVGADGQRSTAEKVRDGIIYATPTTTPLMATYALETAIKHLDGENVNAIVNAPSQLVTKENAQEYVDSDLCW
jgi:ribose transport system substrate-binding protein